MDRRLSCSSIVPLLLTTVSCMHADPRPSAVKDTEGRPLRFCAAVRGNGELIAAHFGSLARLVEHYGLLDGVAGASSGSITAFVYESIAANPLLEDCGDHPCSEEESRLRAATLLKSGVAYLQMLTKTPEAVAFGTMIPFINQVKALGLEKALESPDWQTARTAIDKLMSSPDLLDVANREVLATLANSPDPQYHVKDLVKGIQDFGSYSTDDPNIFVRPGFVDFKKVARKFGRIGNFYAGYGPYDRDGMQAFLKACAVRGPDPEQGLPWSALAAIPTASGTCGAVFDRLLTTYRQKLIANEGSFPSRVDDPVGKFLPTLVVTSLLEGDDGPQRFAKARERYQQAKALEWSMNFESVRIGYWGTESDLERVGGNPRGYDDLKTQRFVPLGERPWAEILQYSPAEPSISRLQEMSPTRVSAGGWPDLHPVQVLKNLGCENVVYVTRRGEESNFLQGVTTLLGITDKDRAAYFSLDPRPGEKPSAMYQAVREAEGVWCTDWNTYKFSQLEELTAHSYQAPFEARSAFFQQGQPRYPNAQAAVNFRGCTPGAPTSP